MQVPATACTVQARSAARTYPHSRRRLPPPVSKTFPPCRARHATTPYATYTVPAYRVHCARLPRRPYRMHGKQIIWTTRRNNRSDTAAQQPLACDATTLTVRANHIATHQRHVVQETQPLHMCPAHRLLTQSRAFDRGCTLPQGHISCTTPTLFTAFDVSNYCNFCPSHHSERSLRSCSLLPTLSAHPHEYHSAMRFHCMTNASFPHAVVSLARVHPSCLPQGPHARTITHAISNSSRLCFLALLRNNNGQLLRDLKQT